MNSVLSRNQPKTNFPEKVQPQKLSKKGTSVHHHYIIIMRHSWLKLLFNLGLITGTPDGLNDYDNDSDSASSLLSKNNHFSTDSQNNKRLITTDSDATFDGACSNCGNY